MVNNPADDFDDIEDEVSVPPRSGFFDPQGVFPNRSYIDVQSTNKAERGVYRNELHVGGGHVALNLDIKPLQPTKYPYAQVRETQSGHVIETDDTAGSERVLIKHRTGAGVDLRPDGTVIINARNNTVRVTAGDEKVIVEGNGELVYNGNMKLTVSGNLDINVGGDFNVTTGGDKKETIKGSTKYDITGSQSTTVGHNMSTNVGDNRNDLTFGFHSSIVKGNWDQFVEGDGNLFVGYKDPDDGSGKKYGTLVMTGTRDVVIASQEINMNGEKIVATADSGTFGGENVIMYNYNMYTGHSITANDTITTNTAYTTRVNATSMFATTFIGDLTGRADEAIASDTAIFASYGGGPGGPAGWTNTDTQVAAQAVDPLATFKQDNTNIKDLLHKQFLGTRSVTVNESLKDAFRKENDYNNIAERKLTPAEVRAKLRDPITLANQDFISEQQIEGKLGTEFNTITPAFGYGRIENREQTPKRGTNILPGAGGGVNKRFT